MGVQYMEPKEIKQICLTLMETADAAYFSTLDPSGFLTQHEADMVIPPLHLVGLVRSDNRRGVDENPKRCVRCFDRFLEPLELVFAPQRDRTLGFLSAS